MNYFLLFLLLLSTPAFAGGYYEPHIDTYDPASGLYYKAVHDHTTEGGFLSSKSSRNTITNINIFDPANGTSTILFKAPKKEGISIVIFETGFKNSEIEFNATHSNLVMNNSRISKREPKNKLLIGIRSADSKETTLFVSDKRGAGLKKLASVPATADWHIDVKNSKLRVVHQTGKGVRIESYEW